MIKKAEVLIERMKSEGDKVNGEYYVGPTYNYLDLSYGPINNSFVGNLNDVMFGLGTPEDYEYFLKSSVSVSAERKTLSLLRNQT